MVRKMKSKSLLNSTKFNSNCMTHNKLLGREETKKKLKGVKVLLTPANFYSNCMTHNKML